MTHVSGRDMPDRQCAWRREFPLVSTGAVLAYAASAIVIAWGSAHLAPTRAVAASFGANSLDNRRIFVMEWMAEGITHISIGVLVILARAIEGATDRTTRLLYVVSAGVLLPLLASRPRPQRGPP